MNLLESLFFLSSRPVKDGASRALHFLYYNFVRIHEALKMTPAMAASVTDRVQEVANMVETPEV